MHAELSLLRRLQDLDLRIVALTREIKNLPHHVARIQGRLQAHKQELAKTQEILADNGKEHRYLEGQIADCTRKISKLQDQMNIARTNEQFRAFQHEIQFCKDSIDGFEERILEKMEQAEDLEANVKRAKASLKEEEASVKRDVALATARIAADQKEREQRLVQRTQLAATADTSALRTYERIRKTRGRAMTAVDDEICEACHMRVRPKPLQDLYNESVAILTCESCGLILYLKDDIELTAVTEDPAGDEMAAASRS